MLAFPNRLFSSAKSALHGLIHWLSQTYSSKGITVNGVAPALIQNTSILPGNVEALAKSKSHISLHKKKLIEEKKYLLEDWVIRKKLQKQCF